MRSAETKSLTAISAEMRDLAARARDNRVKSMSLLEPTLEDVFMQLTGRALRDE